MNKFLFFLLISLSLPMISPAQDTNITAEEANMKGEEYYNRKDYTEAVKWYRKAADLGNASGQFNLGVMYSNGYGVTQDKAEAVKWYRKAADQGRANAQYNLGVMYDNGVGVTQDKAEAAKWYRKAADQGRANAQYNLGVMYQYGEGVTQDKAEAVKWYRKAADQGRANAQFNLGLMYDFGEGVTQDKAEAVKWYRKAADQGDARAQCNLGLMYDKGEGVTQDRAEAVKWYRKAADQGDDHAQCNLGWMYYKGYGVTKDYAEAVKWYRKAADQGYASAQNDLGYMYYMGYGVEKDYKMAKEWYEKAIAQDDAHAMEGMGELYEYGHGVTKNYQTAKEWYKKALNKNPNISAAKEGLARVDKILSGQSNTNNSIAQNRTTTTQPKQKPKEQQPKQQPVVQPQTKVETFLVDTDIPVISRVNRNTFAIIIANENYSRETKVDYARNDGEVFKNYCHKTLGLPEKNVHFMPDATLNDLIGELDWLSQVCKAFKGEASVIFYYAGHGIPDEASGSAYLLPTDGNSRLLRTCFSINELYETLGSLPAKKVTVLMDACFSGAKRNGDMLASARGVAIKAKMGAPKGSMIVLSAAKGDETAYKYEDAKHGLFTYFLLKKLKDSKGNVTLGELSRYIQDQVGRYSIVENGKSQTPTVQASDNLKGRWESMMFE